MARHTEIHSQDGSKSMLSKKVKAEDILSAIRGPQGRAGYDGCDGLDGSDGKEGSQGKVGMHGDPGARGPTGPTGPQGVKGDKGDQGRTGQAGDGEDGVSVTGSTINNRGDLIIKLSNGDLINAGRAKGQPGPPGQPGRNGGIISQSGVAGSLAWNDYAINKVQYTGVETGIASGLVLECISDGDTIYRFINSTDNANGYPIEDSFYSDFNGTILTNLIITRG